MSINFLRCLRGGGGGINLHSSPNDIPLEDGGSAGARFINI